jgi:hypothetical protein
MCFLELDTWHIFQYLQSGFCVCIYVGRLLVMYAWMCAKVLFFCWRGGGGGGGGVGFDE